ncbi:hypothetical protein GALL_263760 [mine drainage metagenome]|uniref:Uncharacterized protein n=1 Tax=mine drainage metagenome TaxID=410659 RepID=A0A1J5R6R0_9ZZZZ
MAQMTLGGDKRARKLWLGAIQGEISGADGRLEAADWALRIDQNAKRITAILEHRLTGKVRPV